MKLKTHFQHPLKALALVTALIVLSSLLLAACGKATPAPTAPPPTATPVPPVTPVPEGDSWPRIEAAGKILVGTSADYPPFESYNENFQVEGFDMELISLIGQRLGLQIRDSWSGGESRFQPNLLRQHRWLRGRPEREYRPDPES